MANRLRGEAEFVHDGQQLTLLIDAEVLLQVEDATGVSLLDRSAAGSNKLAFVAQLLRFGLARGSQVEIDRATAAEMIMLDEAVGVAVMTALARALPEAKEGAGENPRKAARKKTGTGKSS